MDPLSKVEIFFAKWGLYLIIGAIVILAIVGWLGYNSWRNAQNSENKITAQHRIGVANTQGGQAAVNTTDRNNQANEDTDAKLPPIINNYNSYPAAKQVVDHAFLDAFDRSLCVYRSASNLVQCRGMQQADPGEVENK